jgi:hypothetical protein
MDIDEMEPSPLKAQIGRGRGLSTVDDTIKNDDVSLREEAEQGRKLSHDTIQPFSEANESETKKKEVEYVNLGKILEDSVTEEEQHAPSFEPIMQAQEPQPNAPGAFRVRGPGVDSTVDDEEEFTVTPSESTDGQQENMDKLLSAVLVDPEQDRREIEDHIEHEVEERLEKERAERERQLANAEPMSKYWCTPRARILGVSVLFLITVAIVTIAVVMTSKPPPAVSTLDIPPSLSWFVERVPQSPSFEEGTAQYDALEWLISEIDILGEFDQENQLQFFSLAVLYFSTDGDNWINGGKDWLSGIVNERNITKLDLSENNLQGRIPAEMGLLRAAHWLIWTSIPLV